MGQRVAVLFNALGYLGWASKICPVTMILVTFLFFGCCPSCTVLAAVVAFEFCYDWRSVRCDLWWHVLKWAGSYHFVVTHKTCHVHVHFDVKAYYRSVIRLKWILLSASQVTGVVHFRYSWCSNKHLCVTWSSACKASQLCLPLVHCACALPSFFFLNPDAQFLLQLFIQQVLFFLWR